MWVGPMKITCSRGILGIYPPCGCGQASGAVGATPVTGGHVAAVGVSWQEWVDGMVVMVMGDGDGGGGGGDDDGDDDRYENDED